MSEIRWRRDSREDPNRITSDEGERIRAQQRALAARRERLDRAAALFLKTVAAEGYFVLAGQEFLDAAVGLDREAIIERAAAKLAERLSRASLEEARRGVWNDARRLFGWRNLTSLDPAGTA